jgi:DNA-binding NarL/FixJ family response regulator
VPDTPTLMKLHVDVHDVGSYGRLARRAEAAGFPSVRLYLQHVIDDLQSIRTPRDEVEQLHADGHTNTEICERTGLTRLAVQTHLQALLRTPNRERTPR